MEWITPTVHSCCGTLCGYFVDNSFGSSWRHQADHLHWIILDLGESKRVKKIRIYNRCAGTYDDWTSFDVYVSNSPVVWGDPVAENITAPWCQGAWIIRDIILKNGRYIKLADIVTAHSGGHLFGAEFDALVEDIDPPWPFVGRTVATGDDGYCRAQGSWFRPGDHFEAGYNGTLGTYYDAWTRFPGVTVPPGVNIDHIEARLSLYVSGLWPTAYLRVFGEDANNPLAPGSFADYYSRARTANYGDRTVSATAWQAIDVTGVVREILNRPGWVSGNAVQLFIEHRRLSGGRISAEACCWAREHLYPRLELYFAPPVVTAVNPDEAYDTETLDVVITGSNFIHATSVSFGAEITVNSFIIDSNTQITANITIAYRADPGARDVSVTDPRGTGTLSSGFTVLALARRRTYFFLA